MVEKAEERESEEAHRSIDLSVFAKRVWRRITISIVPLRKLGNLSLLLFLSLLFSSLQHFSFLSSTILVRFLLSRRGKRRGRKSSCSSLRHGSSSKHGGFRAGVVPPRDREREEARACVSPIKARRRERTRNRYGRETRNKR